MPYKEPKVMKTRDTWKDMVRRCTKETDPNYRYYGGKGVTVDEYWKQFYNFFLDMGYRPDGMTLERIDPSKGYSKENCRWATMAEQNRNKSDNVFIEYNGTRLCIADWAKKAGLRTDTLWCRLKNGWKIDRALTTPPLRKGCDA